MSQAEGGRHEEVRQALKAAQQASDAAWREKVEQMLSALEDTKGRLASACEECTAEQRRTQQALSDLQEVRSELQTCRGQLAEEAAQREIALKAHANGAATSRDMLETIKALEHQVSARKSAAPTNFLYQVVPWS